MLRDGLNDDTIYFYVVRKGYRGSAKTLWNYIYCIEKNNFPDRIPMNPNRVKEWQYPRAVIIIKRNNLLKYLLTKNPKIKKDETIGKYIEAIKVKYPIVEKLETMFNSFYSVVMGDNPEDIDTFLEIYDGSEIDSFCKGIKKDIIPVKNAISSEVSSGFIEGNNKFKLIKRIVYGRSKLVNLSKKSILAFSVKKEDFNLFDLI